MGRKISKKEQAATNTALDLLKTSKSQIIKAQIIKLLFESDWREKARVDAREKQKFKLAHDKKLIALSSQVKGLEEDINTKNQLIEGAKTATQQSIDSALAAQKEKIDELEGKVAASDDINGPLRKELEQAEKKILSIQKDVSSFIVGILAYRQMPEYNPTILDEALQSRINSAVSEEEKAKAGKVIAMLDPEFRELQEDLQTLSSLKQEKRPPLELFDVATSGIADVSARDEARKTMTMLYGWTNFNVSKHTGDAQWWLGYSPQIYNLKRRTDEEILATMQSERNSQMTTPQRQKLVKCDNERAGKLSEKLLNYRQCNNCMHVSHGKRTAQARCHHCGQVDWGSQAITWLPLVKTTVPPCDGAFPCKKPS